MSAQHGYQGAMGITSSCPAGMVVTMNAYIAPANQAAYLEAARPIVKAMRESPENNFVAVSINPTDPGHVRFVHGWKKDSAWFSQNFIKGPYFEEFNAKTVPMSVKDRVIEHFDLVPIE